MKTNLSRILVCGLACIAALEVLATPGEAPVRIGPLQIYSHDRPRGQHVVIGNDITVAEGEILRELVVISGQAQINGTIERDVVVVLGQAKLGPSASIGGDLVVVAGTLEMDPTAKVRGQQIRLTLDAQQPWFRGVRDWVTEGLLLGRPLPHQSGILWIVAILLLVLYVVAAALLPGPLQYSVGILKERPVSSFFSGLLALLLVGPLVLLLAISMVGIAVIPFLLCAVGLAFLFGKVSVYSWAGQQLGGQLGLTAFRNPALAVLLGGVLFYLLYLVPLLGFMVWGIVATLGFGAVIMAAMRGLRSEASPPTPILVPANPVAGSVSGASLEASAAAATPGMVALTRAGFWVRTFAACLDALLAGVLLKMVDLPHLFPFLLVAYHFAMWSWKGTTLGGIVLGLQIVRTDGRPIDYGVALVRCLSAIFSALALCLGFFWVAWDRDKQSWHDKIAGTVIVRVPRPAALI